MLKGAVIVFITAGYSGKKFIFEKVKCPAIRERSQEASPALSALRLLKSELLQCSFHVSLVLYLQKALLTEWCQTKPGSLHQHVLAA